MTNHFAYYGCSVTAGVGVAPGEIWTDHMNTLLGVVGVNYGVRAAGIEHIAEVFRDSAESGPITHAVFLLPAPDRITVACDDGNRVKILPSVSSDLAKIIYSLPSAFFVDRAESAVRWIESFSRLQSIQTYYSSWDIGTMKLLKQLGVQSTTDNCWNDRGGTDHMHPSPAAQQRFAEQFIEIMR
jgi:hypothetical protein